MTKTQQKAFVRSLAKSVVAECVGHIRADKVPESWDGHELRMWMAEKFEDSAEMSVIHKEPRSRRARAYRNYMLVTYI